VSIWVRNFLNSIARCRRWMEAMTVAVGDVERGEQAGHAVPDVVVGAPLGHAGDHRQYRAAAGQGLDLALLVHAEHDRAFAWVQVEADHVIDLLHEHRVRGQLERIGPVRLELEGLPDPPDRGLGPIVVLDRPDRLAIDAR